MIKKAMETACRNIEEKKSRPKKRAAAGVRKRT
jgi:hypothetical protein